MAEGTAGAGPEPGTGTGTGTGTLRRIGRWALRGFLVLAILLVVAFFAATEPIDRSPILGTPVAARTDANIAAEAKALEGRPVERGALKVGWASAVITPPLGTATLGYGARLGKGIEKVEDDLMAHALAVSAGDGPPVVFLSADICLWLRGLSAQVVSGVADVLPRDRLYFGATHTHCGPSGFVNGWLFQLMMGGPNPEAVRRIVDGSVKAIREAIASREPGQWRDHATSVPELIENRMRQGEAVDDELVVFEFQKLASGKKFALVNYCAHATAIAHDYVCGSGDWPGRMVRDLKAKGFDDAAFFAAGTGQAGPALDGRAAYAASTADAYEVGDRMAARVAALATGAADVKPEPWVADAALSLFRCEVALPPYNGKRFGRRLRPDTIAWLFGDPSPRAFVQAVRLGETVFIGHSFEFSSVIERELKARLRAKGGPRLVVTSFNGDHNLYVIPDKSWDEGVYESGMTLYGPGLGSYLDHVTEEVYDVMAARK
ncbi:MAG TPA: neutral/alkaline non-lysosomal ceramidase N-terminal domain-containing protein [Planctomycetota bacterium]|nr:neutral/alkaline non-lysosomal ceramidase N-terminal domain-containing protein [Planctomycetota bacterium]